MKAVVYYGAKDIRLEDVDVPKIKEGEILIKMRACGVCATDIKTFLKGHPLIKPPNVLGHEVVGDVIDVGSNVTKFRRGDHVVVAPYVPCNACYFCRRKAYTLCDYLFREGLVPGGFAEIIKVPASIVEKGTIKIPHHIPYETATLTEPLACCIHGIEKCKVRSDDSVAIIGDGPIGLLYLQLIRSMGANKVFICGHHEYRLKIAEDLGADITINSGMENPIKRVMELTENRGTDITIVCAGSLLAAEQGIRMTRKGGITILFGGFPSGSVLEVDPNIIHYSELIVTGSFGFSPDNFRKAFRLIKSGKINAGKIITHKVSLDEILNVIDLLASRKCLKAVIIA
ncbi:MAG: zinc-dependent dehydrogenase [Candidatus Bathyarchaeia archaeon]